MDWKSVILIGACCLGSQAYGDILTSSFVPSRVVAGEDDQFPESRFGTAPHPGTLEGEIEATEEAHRLGSRSPASGPTSGTGTGLVSESSNLLKPLKLKPSSLMKGGVQEVSLIVGDLGFFPKTLFVTRDIPVKLFVTGASKKTLCIMMDSFEIRRQIRSQKIEEIDFTPSAPGQYRIYCPVNGMEGTLLVKEITTIANTVASEPQNSSIDSKPQKVGVQGD